MEAERHLRVMGSEAHVVVNGHRAGVLLAAAVARVRPLAKRWSPFIRSGGSAGCCCGPGGELRGGGRSASAGTWTLAVGRPARTARLARLGLAGGAVATSTTLRRQWQVHGELRHHLIDPATGRPSTSD